MNTKVTIAVPSNRGVKGKTVESLMKMIAYSKDVDYNIVVASEGYTISENRTYLTVQAINSGSTHLLFIDDDMVFPEDTLERLLSHKKDVIGVAYHSRNLSKKLNILSEDGEVIEDKDIKEDLMKVQHVGTGTMLIDLEVFKKIDRPWYKMETHIMGFTLMGEDAWFCKQAREKKIDIWCDTTIKVGHIGDYTY